MIRCVMCGKVSAAPLNEACPAKRAKVVTHDWQKFEPNPGQEPDPFDCEHGIFALACPFCQPDVSA